MPPSRLGSVEENVFKKFCLLLILHFYLSLHNFLFCIHDAYFIPSRSAKYCNKRVCMYVCLFVWLSVRSHTPTCPNFVEFSVRVTCGYGSALWWQCNMLCTYGFVDDIMYSHNGANGPGIHVSSSLPGDVTGGKVCRIWLIVYLFSVTGRKGIQPFKNCHSSQRFFS